MSEAENMTMEEKRSVPSIEQLTPKERQELLFALTENAIGPVPAPATDGSQAVILPFFSMVPPGITTSISVHAYATFKPEHLIISEPVVECYHTISETIDVRTKAAWWKKIHSHTERKTYREKSTIAARTLNRGTWVVSGIFVGNRSQFPMTASLRGDIFCPGPLNSAPFRDVCSANLAITFQVSHSGKEDLPFHAIVTGKIVPDIRVTGEHGIISAPSP